jgi:AcrR family transcriptional regulator
LNDINKQKAKRRDQIVEAAAQVFAQKGYSGAVVADIAIQANIGKGTVEWFQKKTENAAAVGISALGGGAADRLKVLNDSLMGQWDEIKDVFVLVMEFWAASSSTQMRQRFKGAFKQLYDDYRHIVSALIREGINSGEFRPDVKPEPVAAALVGTWDALFLQAWFDDSFDPAATANDWQPKPNPDKPEIRNSKYEIRNKFLITKIQMIQTKKS